MKRYLAVLLVAGAALVGAQVAAHHSFAATYLEDKSVTIEGELVQFQFRNPHSFVHVLVADPNGKEDCAKGKCTRYAVEWGGAGALGGQGVSRETLKPGDYVVISGSPGRNPEDNRVRMVNLRRPSDGFCWGCRAGETFD